jgi:hypothetical protein
MKFSFLKYFFISLILCLSLCSSGQDSKLASLKMLTMNMGLAYNIPNGALANQYGNYSTASFGTSYYLKGKIFTLFYQFGFGSNIKEDALKPYRDVNGIIYGGDGLPANVYMRMRTNFIGFTYGMSLPITKGGWSIVGAAGPGYFTHKTAILDDSQTVPWVSPPYVYLLDNLSRGPALRLESGIAYHSEKSSLNFSLNLIFVNAYTTSVRKEDMRHMSNIGGIEAKWMLPLFKASNSAEIKYY